VTYRNRIGGGAHQGEWAHDHEAVAIKERSRRSGTRAGTADESYLGRSRFTLERETTRRMTRRSEKSAAAVVAAGFGEGGSPQREGPNGEKSESTVHHDKARHQKSVEQIELPLEDRGQAPGLQHLRLRCARRTIPHFRPKSETVRRPLGPHRRVSSV